MSQLDIDQLRQLLNEDDAPSKVELTNVESRLFKTLGAGALSASAASAALSASKASAATMPHAAGMSAATSGATASGVSVAAAASSAGVTSGALATGATTLIAKGVIVKLTIVGVVATGGAVTWKKMKQPTEHLPAAPSVVDAHTAAGDTAAARRATANIAQADTAQEHALTQLTPDGQGETAKPVAATTKSAHMRDLGRKKRGGPTKPNPKNDRASKTPVHAKTPGVADVMEASDDTLADEMVLLSTVDKDTLRSSDALSRLMSHKKRFPKGKLALERDLFLAARACLTGKTEQGMGALERLQKHSNHPLYKNAKESCHP